MASNAAKAQRRMTAHAELSKRIGRLSKKYDIEVPESPPRSFDPELQPILEMEWQIALLDVILDKLAHPVDEETVAVAKEVGEETAASAREAAKAVADLAPKKASRESR